MNIVSNYVLACGSVQSDNINLLKSLTRSENVANVLEDLYTKYKDVYWHCLRVYFLTMQMATLNRYSPRIKSILGAAALLHDIGKMHVPAEILYKPARLTPDEFSIITQHSENSITILKERGIKAYDKVVQAILEHHEKDDGSGYPFGKKRDEMWLPGRLISVADVLDAQTCERIYKPSIDLFTAMNNIKREFPLDFPVLESFVNEVIDVKSRYKLCM